MVELWWQVDVMLQPVATEAVVEAVVVTWQLTKGC